MAKAVIVNFGSYKVGYDIPPGVYQFQAVKDLSHIKIKINSNNQIKEALLYEDSKDLFILNKNDIISCNTPFVIKRVEKKES